MAQTLRLGLLRDLAGISVGGYLRRVVVPIVCVSLLSAALPLAVYHGMEESLCRLVCVVIVSCLSVLVFSYAAGLDEREKQFVRDKIKSTKERLQCFR